MPSMASDPEADEAATDERAGHWERGRGSGLAADLLPMDRYTAFTDGVVAIAITLLVLERHVPTGPNSC